VETEPTYSVIDIPIIGEGKPEPLQNRLRTFPWWFVALLITLALTFFLVLTTQNYREAFTFIAVGLGVTTSISLISYSFALVIGLIAGMGRISRNVLYRNVSTYYVEVVRGVPMLVLIFYIAFVFVPDIIGGVNQFGFFLEELSNGQIGSALAQIENQSFSTYWRAVIALSITYGAFLAEIFRAGIESIERGQMEAARSLGMSYRQAMRYVILPQAIRNVLPALGNDFIAMVKDSSLVSVLAVRDITQIARLFAGRSFRFREAYTILVVLYLTITIILSLSVRIFERRMSRESR
jgi:polar amino acid transport system permease protein